MLGFKTIRTRNLCSDSYTYLRAPGVTTSSTLRYHVIAIPVLVQSGRHTSIHCGEMKGLPKCFSCAALFPFHHGQKPEDQKLNFMFTAEIVNKRSIE